MWIRSQDKETLADLRMFDIGTGYANLPYKICGYSDGWANANNFYIDLGHYSTKEKAMKVLDMIQKRIIEPIRMNTIEYGAFASNDYEISLNAVFQMPQDDEVN